MLYTCSLYSAVCQIYLHHQGTEKTVETELALIRLLELAFKDFRHYKYI